MERKYPDGPRINVPLAIAGQMLPWLYRFDALLFADRIARKFGDFVHYKFGPLHVYQLTHPSLAREVLVEQPEKFRKPELIRRAFRPVAGEGLFTSDGALWKRQRKLMQPAFLHRHLAAYADVMVSHAQALIDSYKDGEIRDIGADMTGLTLAIVVKTLFGADLPRAAREIGRSMSTVLDATNQRLNSLVQIPSWFPTPRNLRERFALARLDAALQVLIRARRDSKESRGDLLSILLAAADEESGARMSDRQLRDEMMTLFLAGHETTADALIWTWYLLSRHPEVEAKLADELRRVLAGRLPSAADLPNLPYTEMVIRESMRLYPPAPGVAREAAEDVIIAGFEIPKGSLITINTYVLHRDERFFPEPERFDPERFAPGWEERIPRYAYLPFGGGPRVCIGNGFAMMEARLILATIARSYRFSMRRAETVQPVQMVTLRPRRPVRMQVERR
ncbi:MAG TPA: cytochrome P450 [Bryobacteraceae bacterium]|nr:cytochrome P450 [Bryobacteraceae bacterium]